MAIGVAENRYNVPFVSRILPHQPLALVTLIHRQLGFIVPQDNPQQIQALADQFIDWLISVPTQEMIGQFGLEEFGDPLFTPDSAPWREAQE